ncbi:MAG: FAD-binding protein [Planctomycetota bacterium]|jgi:succinate dehydrogenase / fumarate reductase flavoprotein subunit|nr:FAD-binding protein [Planctomycetota bacterium]
MSSVPQQILDALTRVEMPKVVRAELPADTMEVAGTALPVYRCGALVVGSGAAGLRAAVEAKRLGEDVLIITMSPFGGTSACSGSDKQTLHTAGTGRHGDDFVKLAADIGSGGCMDQDTAYIEAVGSINALAGLQYLGLPLPQDRFGAVLRYQTDHDDVGRATSCGPRTSRLMCKVLAEEALRLQIPFLPKCEAVKILQHDGRCVGVVAIDQNRRDEPGHGLCVILAGAVVLATGGPGELYRDSVYPKHCYGSLGMAIEAGLAVTNLTESQFGIGTRRTEFPWNLSGTYVQVLPYIYSVDADGTEHNFLADYYRTTRELVSNVFRKGYQWPFHAQRMVDFGSSLVDLAIQRESAAGRTVYMDFLRNPEPGANGAAFSLEDLDDDVREYLVNNEALHELPIARLERMNPLAIELYKMHGTDLRSQPLPFNVSNQHMNGGVAVDSWFHSSLPGCYAVGEVCGSHGVTRPGGAALNAGQVGGVRCARHLHEAGCATSSVSADTLREQVAASLNVATTALAADTGLQVSAVRDAIQARMSDQAGFICERDAVAPALAEAQSLRDQALTTGFAIGRPSQVADIFRWRHLALASEAVLTALDHYIRSGGGSRGARALVAADGALSVDTRHGAIEGFRIVPENPAHQQHKITLRWNGSDFALSEEPIRQREDLNNIFFEKHWPAYLTGAIYRDGFKHN